MRKNFGAKTYSYPCPVLMIGTYDENGDPDVMNVAWGGLCLSAPAKIAINIATSRKTFKNIMLNKEFTVSPATEDMYEIADYFGLESGNSVDKIAKTGVHVSKAENVNAPLIEEFPLTLECKVDDIYIFGERSRVLGLIVNASADESILGDDGLPDHKKLKPIIFDPVHNMYTGFGDFIGPAFKAGLKYK